MHTDRGAREPPDPVSQLGPERSSHGQLIGLGAQFAAAIVLFVFVGQWVDRRFGTGPWGVLVGAAVGFATGFYALLRAADRVNKTEEDRVTDKTGSVRSDRRAPPGRGDA